jgi:hypothetical protein
MPEYGEPFDDYPCFVGANLHGFGRIIRRPCPPELIPLFHDDGEGFLERETAYDSILLGRNSAPEPPGVDLGFRACWRNQQSFVRNILAWYPVFDEQFCIDLVKNATDSGFEPSKASTCLALFILALGAFTRAEDTLTLRSTRRHPVSITSKLGLDASTT